MQCEHGGSVGVEGENKHKKIAEDEKNVRIRQELNLGDT